MNPPPFTHFGRYRLLEELGRGAMGIVYLAEDESLQRKVAVKAMLLEQDTDERAEHERRFLQEAKAAGGLNHPNVITIHDLGREGDWLYIAMELLRGTELSELATAGKLSLPQALDIVAQVASGLAAAHAQGIVHRDIKPSNIMVLPDGHAKIMDFGVARVQSAAVRTQTGVMLGSPKYMSPEQVTGHAADPRSDIFSLGSMLYELAAGRPAFSGASLGELLAAIRSAPLPAASQFNPQVPAQLDAILARALQKNPADRYQDARELEQDLQACRALLAAAPAAEAAMDLELFDSTVAGLAGAEATVVAAPPFLRPSPRFDSVAGLRQLLQEGQGDETAGDLRRARQRRFAWIAAVVVAAGCALAIAVT